MTIRELIAQLSQLDPNTPVLVAGYESGYDLASVVKPIHVVKSIDPTSYEGAYETIDPMITAPGYIVDGIVIGTKLRC